METVDVKINHKLLHFKRPVISDCSYLTEIERRISQEVWKQGGSSYGRENVGKNRLNLRVTQIQHSFMFSIF